MTNNNLGRGGKGRESRRCSFLLFRKFPERWMPLPPPSKCGAAGRACPAGSMDFAAVEQKAEWRDERRKGGRVKNGSRSVEVDRARLACCRCGRASLSLSLSLSMSTRAPVKNNENSGRALANRLSPLYSFYQHEKDLIALYLPPQSVCALGTRAKAYTHTHTSFLLPSMCHTDRSRVSSNTARFIASSFEMMLKFFDSFFSFLFGGKFTSIDRYFIERTRRVKCSKSIFNFRFFRTGPLFSRYLNY